MSKEEAKKRAAVYAADFVRSGMKIGLGTGSTVYWLIEELGNRIKQGLNISVVPTSTQTQLLAKRLNIPVIDLNAAAELDLTIDGADEIDTQLQLIKGGGGALLREKIVAAASKELIIIADHSKYVQRLGKFPLPVEVIPFGYQFVLKKIQGMRVNTILRIKQNNPFITDSGNYILDCFFKEIDNPFELNSNLHLIPGVVETGLFIDVAKKVIIAADDLHIQVFLKK